MHLQTFLKRNVLRDLHEFINYHWDCIKMTDISQFCLQKLNTGIHTRPFINFCSWSDNWVLLVYIHCQTKQRVFTTCVLEPVYVPVWWYGKTGVSRSISGLWPVFSAEINAIMLNESKHDLCYMHQALFAEQVLKYSEIVVSKFYYRIFPIAERNCRSYWSDHFWSWHYVKPLFILNSCSRSSSLRKLSIKGQSERFARDLHQNWPDNDLFHRDSWLNRITDF